MKLLFNLWVSLFFASVVWAQQTIQSTRDRKLYVVAHTNLNTTSNPIFIFYSDEFWLNLHHFLYVLGRARNHESDSSRDAVVRAPEDEKQALGKLTADEQRLWQEAVAAYGSGLSKKDAMFDDPLPEIAGALARAGDSSRLAGTSVGSATAQVL